MKVRAYLFVGIAVAFSAVATRAQDVRFTELQRQAVDQAVAEQMREQRAVGVAVGVIQDGKVVYLQGYGLADRPNNIAVTPATMFRWASVSKPVTAIAAMQLVDQGKLDLTADVRKYVTEFPDKGAVITARDLLCHQSGIVHYVNGPVIKTKTEYDRAHPFENVVLALDTFKESPLVNQPGEKFSYSTHAYILLSAVVQRAGQQPFAEQVQDRICKTLGLTSLQPDYQWIAIENRAVGYRLRNDRIVRSTNTDVSWKLGGGGFISNIEDMAKLACGLVNKQLLSDSSYQQMWTRQTTLDGAATGMGLGFSVAGSGDQLVISHNGSQEKTRTRMVIHPAQKSGLVLMTNSEYVNPGRFTAAIFKALAIHDANRN